MPSHQFLFHSLTSRLPYNTRIKSRKGCGMRINGATSLPKMLYEAGAVSGTHFQRNVPNGLTIFSQYHRFQKISRCKTGDNFINLLRELVAEPPQCGRADAILLQQLAAHLYQTYSTFRPGQILECLVLFSQMEYSDNHLLHTFEESLDDMVLQCSSVKVVHLCYICNEMGFCTNHIINRLFKKILEHTIHFQWEPMIEILHACVRSMGYQNGPICLIHYDRPLKTILDILSYRATLLLAPPINTPSITKNPLIGEVIHYISRLLPHKVESLFSAFINSYASKILMDEDVNNSSSENETVIIEDQKEDILYHYEKIQTVIERLPVKQLIYLLSGIVRTTMFPEITNIIENRILELIRLTITPSRGHTELTRLLSHLKFTGLNSPEIINFCGYIVTEIGLQQELSSSLLERYDFCFSLNAIISCRYNNISRLLNTFQNPCLINAITGLSSVSLVNLFYATCMLEKRVLLSPTLHIFPFLPLFEALLTEIRLLYRQLTLNNRRRLQRCLCYLYYTYQEKPIGIQALDLARRISRQKHPDSNFTDQFTVALSPTQIPLFPRDFALTLHDVIQVGPFTLFQSTKEPEIYTYFLSPLDYCATPIAVEKIVKYLNNPEEITNKTTIVHKETTKFKLFLLKNLLKSRGGTLKLMSLRLFRHEASTGIRLTRLERLRTLTSTEKTVDIADEKNEEM